MDVGYISIIILLVSIVFYVMELLPISIIAMLSAAACVVFKVIPASTAWAAFSGNVVLIMGGVILVGSTLFETGAAGILAEKLIKWTGGKPKFTIFAIMIISGVMSGFLSNTAVTIMFLPIIISVVAKSNGTLSEQKYMQALTIMTSVGGLLTLIGSPIQLAASGMLESSGQSPFTFMQFFYIAMPMLIVSIVYIFTIGDKISDKIWGKNPAHGEFVENFLKNQEIIDLKNSEKEQDTAVEKEKKRKIVTSSIIMLLTVIGMLTTKYHGISMGTIGVLAGLSCVVTKCITVKQMYEKIDWATLFLLAGCIGFASGLSASGGGKMIADFFIGLFGDNLSPTIVFLVMTLLAAVITQFMSNAATASMLVPIGVALAIGINMNPLPVAIGVTMAASCSFLTPMASPTQALIINWGGYNFKDYIKYSGLITIILNIMILVLTPLVYPLV